MYAFHEDAERIIGFGPFVSGCDGAAVVRAAIAEHGRPALCRASGICTTVLGKMLAYADDQPIKPETWRKLETGIAAMDACAASDPAHALG